MDKEEQLKKLKEEYKDCCKCSELCKNRHNIVFGGGKVTSKIMIIGEAPGSKEDLENIPFIGKSGQILNSLLLDVGISREEIYITNTVLCRPPNNRDPNKDELENCRKRLDEQIKIINPNVIITLGNFATKYILNTTEGITKLKGKVYDINNRKVVPMFHPAVLLYNGNNPEKRKELLDDFKPVKELLNANIEYREQQKIENKIMKCPKCKKGDLAITYSKKNRRQFVACDAYPNCKNTFSLPPNGTIKKMDKICEHCNWPMMMRLSAGKRPWMFCFNPECSSNKERMEAYRKKQEDENSEQQEANTK